MNDYKGLISLPGLSLGGTRNSRNARTTRPPWRRTFGAEGMISKPEIMFQTKAKILKMLITVSSHWGHVNSVIDIGFNIMAFLLPTHHAKFRRYRNVKRNVCWNQCLDAITSAQKDCTKSHSLLIIKPGGTNSSVCDSKHLSWAKSLLRVIFPLFIPPMSLPFFSISLLLPYFSQTQMVISIMK